MREWQRSDTMLTPDLLCKKRVELQPTGRLLAVVWEAGADELAVCSCANPASGFGAPEVASTSTDPCCSEA